MINEKNDLDQLFFRKLGKYEKIPPSSVWANIEGRLNRLENNRRIVIRMIKTVSVAAVIVVALLAGWKMTDHPGKGDEGLNNLAEQMVRKTNNEPVKTTATHKLPANKIIRAASSSTTLLVTGNQAASAKISSSAILTVNSSTTVNGVPISPQKSQDLTLVDSEKDFLNHFQQNYKMVKNITRKIASSLDNNLAIVPTSNSKPVASAAPIQIISEKSLGNSAFNAIKKTAGRWSLKAEFAPVFSSQTQNYGQIRGVQSTGVQSNLSQKSTTENTFSTGIVAGYKVGKRITVKSGMRYNMISQSTQHLGILSVNYKMVSVEPTTFSNENRLKQNFEFVEIPAQVAYKLIDTKFAISLNGGISTNFLVGNKETLMINGQKFSSGEVSNMRGIVYTGILGMEFGYEISKRIALTVEPRLKHYLNPLSTNNSVNYNPDQIEIATGLTYSFN